MFTRLLDLPESKRRSVAFIIAGALTALIVAFWLIGFVEPLRLSDDASASGNARVGARGESSLSPLRTLGESFKSLTESVRAELGGVFWGIGNGESGE